MTIFGQDFTGQTYIISISPVNIFRQGIPTSTTLCVSVM